MNKIGFKLNRINTKHFSIFEEMYNHRIEETSLETSLELGIDSDNHAILVTTKFQFQQQKKQFLELEISCDFIIAPEFWNDFLSKEKITIPKGFLTYLTIITSGTARGILHERTKGTDFSMLVLPVLNLDEMVKEDAVFEK